jgi:hypothetical protein
VRLTRPASQEVDQLAAFGYLKRFEEDRGLPGEVGCRFPRVRSLRREVDEKGATIIGPRTRSTKPCSSSTPSK